MAAIDTMAQLIEMSRSGRVDASVFEWMLDGLVVVTSKGKGVYSGGMLKTSGGVTSLGEILGASVPPAPKVVTPKATPKATPFKSGSDSRI